MKRRGHPGGGSGAREKRCQRSGFLSSSSRFLCACFPSYSEVTVPTDDLFRSSIIQVFFVSLFLGCDFVPQGNILWCFFYPFSLHFTVGFHLRCFPSNSLLVDSRRLTPFPCPWTPFACLPPLLSLASWTLGLTLLIFSRFLLSCSL